MFKRTKRFLQGVKGVAVAFNQDRCFNRASALAYTNLLSIVPLLTIILVVISTFPSMNYVEVRIEDFIFTNLLPSSSKVVHLYIKDFALHATRLSWISLLCLFATVILLLISIESNFNDISKVHSHHVNYFKSSLRYALFSVLMPALLGGSLIVSSYLYSILHFDITIPYLDSANNFLELIPNFLIFVMILFLYKFIPAGHISFRAASWGALFTTIILIVGKQLFKIYIHFFSGYNVLYGAFAAIPLFLLWLYISWVIILLGFEIICYVQSSSKRQSP